jgi:hypothetical protein
VQLRALAVATLVFAGCAESHEPADAMDAPLGPHVRCAGACPWDERCPGEVPARDAPCPAGALVTCGYCRAGAPLDEILAICRDGRWRWNGCGCSGCP